MTGTRRRRRAIRLLAAAVVGAAPLGLAVSAHATPGLLAAGTVVVTNLDTNSIAIISPVSHSTRSVSGHGLNGPLGVAITPNGRTAYVTNSLGNTIVPVNLATGTVGAPVRVGSGPAAIAISPTGRTAYVSNFNDNTVTPVTLSGATPVAHSAIRVGFGPWSIAVTPNDAMVLVSNSEGHSISVINVASGRVTSLPVAGRPQAIALAPDGKHAYVADGQSVTTINLSSTSASLGTVIPVAGGPVGITISPGGRRGYTANTNNTVSILALDSHAVAPTSVSVANLSEPDGITLSPNGRVAYVASASDVVAPIDLAASPIRPMAPIPVGSPSFGIAVVPDQAPIASLKVTAAKAGHATLLDASASVAPNSAIRNYHWIFGDGTSATTTAATITHVYRHGGLYDAAVVVTTVNGTSTETTFTGQVVGNHGGASAQATSSFHVPSALQLSPASGTPGSAVKLVDNTITRSCNPAYVFFDKNLIATSAVRDHTLTVEHLVIPGNATVGEHHISLSCSTTLSAIVTANFRVSGAANHLTEFSVAMPSPNELSHHLVGAGGISIGLMLLGRLIAAGFPSEWLDRTYEHNRHRIGGRLRRRFQSLFYDPNRPRSTRRRVLGGTVIFLAFMGAGGLINSFLDPAFTLDRASLWLFLGQSLGIGFVTLASQLPVAISGWRRHRQVHLQVLAGGMVIAMACVATSRLVGLAPGYCYGLIASFLIVPGTSAKEEGRLHFMASLVVLLASTAAFFLAVPVFHTATQTNPSPWLLVLTPALDSMFLAGFASLAFGMFPLPFLPGRHVAKWNETLWLLISGLGLIGFVGVLLSPGSGSQSELQHVGLIPILTGFGIFSAISVGFMVYFRVRPSTTPAEGAEEAEGAASSAEAERDEGVLEG
ncbi:MAG: beta-propeller fold lactonase family protein [Acidobacteriota bacterium]|nr:beta-propeller fold lactonase family protein [Acidobacteriota bacterium]